MQSSLRPSLPGFAVLLSCLAGACRSVDSSADVVDLVRHGEYGRAVQVAEKQVSAKPKDKRAREVLRKARVAYLMNEARQTLFHGDADGALALIDQADALDPGNPTILSWVTKVERQLATEWLDVANELSSSHELDDALEAYETALRYDPDMREAKLGVSRVILTMNYRLGQSKSYYNDGLETFREFLLPQADNSFDKSLLYDSENERAQSRKREVEELLVEERMEVAEGLEEEKLYFAARNEYRLALLIDSGSEAARAGYDRMDREVRAKRTLEDVEMDVRRGDLEQAEERLGEAELLTSKQMEDINEMHGQVEEAELMTKYDRALELERDYRYDEAILLYEELLQASEYFLDVDVRKTALEDFVARAESLYQRVISAESDREALQFLREIDVFWPEYRDVPERLDSFAKRGNQLFSKARKASSDEEALGYLRELAGFWPGYPGLEEWIGRLESGE